MGQGDRKRPGRPREKRGQGDRKGRPYPLPYTFLTLQPLIVGGTSPLATIDKSYSCMVYLSQRNYK